LCKHAYAVHRAKRRAAGKDHKPAKDTKAREDTHATGLARSHKIDIDNFRTTIDSGHP
jgi:hypothetical protein